jgi:predicted nucleic acid-binding protein
MGISGRFPRLAGPPAAYKSGTSKFRPDRRSKPLLLPPRSRGRFFRRFPPACWKPKRASSGSTSSSAQRLRLKAVCCADLPKADRAQELVAEGGTISVQVLNEIANVSRRKMGLSWAETRNFLLMIRGLLEVKPITIEIHDVGISLAEQYQLSVYDSMIVSDALSAGCDTLLSEDLQDGLLINGRLRVLNPF